MFTGEIRRARSKRPMVIGLIFVVIVLAVVLLVPMPHPVASTFTLQPGAMVDVVAPREGVVAEVVSADGAMVATGTVVAKFDLAEAEKQAPELQKKVEALEQRKASGGKVSPAAKAALTRAEAALDKAKAGLEKATRAGKGKTTPAMTAAQKKVDDAQAAADEAKLAAGPTGEALDRELADAQAALAAVKAQLEAKAIVSPGSGLLDLKLEKGAAVTKDAKVGSVADVAKLKALVKVPAGETITKGQAVELTLGTAKKRLVFTGPATGDTAEAEFDNSKGEAKPGTTGDCTIEGTQRSLLSGFL
jgi:multidrug resistance efflux pump